MISAPRFVDHQSPDALNVPSKRIFGGGANHRLSRLAHFGKDCFDAIPVIGRGRDNSLKTIGHFAHLLMISTLFGIALILPCRADQYDVVLGFASLSAAAADPVIQNHMDAIRQPVSM